MKKLILLVLFMLVVSVSTALALPMTWQVSQSFDPPAEYIGWSSTKILSLDLTGNGYVSGMEIDNFTFTAYFADDDEGENDGDENMSLIVGTEFSNAWFPNSLSVGWSALGESDIEGDGRINAFITSNWGDARVWQIKLTAIGDDGFPPVPEPATGLLLFSGLLGGAGLGRRKPA